MQDKITVITPTYNRAKIIDKCYNSLCRQTNKNFLWLVVDDGSKDNTKDIMREYIKEGKINIEYIQKENGGKASALNVALDNVTTKYCTCLDSDDYFRDTTIDTVLEELSKVENKKEICGLIALRTTEKGEVLGNKRIPNSVEKIKFIDIGDKYNDRTEVACFYKSDILKQYRFPIFENEKFVSPAYMQYKITEKYYFKVLQEDVVVCEYLEDGITKNKRNIILKNPKGYTIIKKQSYKNSKKFIKKMKHGIMYGYGSMLAKDKHFIKNSPHIILSILLFPVSYFVFIKSKKRRER